MKLRLIVDVEYLPYGVKKEHLKDMLEDIVRHAASEGLFTNYTDAEVETYSCVVEERS